MTPIETFTYFFCIFNSNSQSKSAHNLMTFNCDYTLIMSKRSDELKYKTRKKSFARECDNFELLFNNVLFTLFAANLGFLGSYMQHGLISGKDRIKFFKSAGCTLLNGS